MKAKQYQSRLQQQLTSNFNICQMIIDREGVNAGKPLIKYQQFMYLILNGRIPLSKIAYFRNKKYTNQQPLLRRTFLVQDGIKISMEVVEKAWRFERSSEKISGDLEKIPNGSEKEIKVHHSTMKIRQAKQTIQNENKQSQQIDHENNEKLQKESPKRQIKSLDKQAKQKKDQKLSKKVKIEELKQNLAMIQCKINATKYEDQILIHQKEYNKCFKQLQYLRNQKRIEKQKTLLKKIEEDNNKSSAIMKKLSELLDQMNKIKAGNAKILDKLPSYEQRISKTEQINRISAIFSHYARKQVGSSQRYFADIEKEISHLNLQIFLKFVQDWELNRILSLEKITNIFKIRSKGKKSVNIFQFNQIINDIHVHQCIAEQKSFTNESNSQYIQEYIVNEVKMNKILLNRSNSKTEPLKSLPNQQRQQSNQNKKVSNYKFKPKSHSGKYIQDIKQELLSKRQRIDFLAGPKNAIKYYNKNSLNLRSNTVENSKIEMGTIETSLYNPTISGNDSINSYAFQFKLKRNKKRYKTEDVVQEEVKNEEENAELCEQNRKNINNRDKTKSRYQESQNSKKNTFSSDLVIGNSQQERALDNLLANLKGDKYNVNSLKDQELENLVNESEEDQYLKKFALPPIKDKRSQKYVHY